MPIHNRPSFTQEFDNLGLFQPSRDSVYVSGSSVEDRSNHMSQWRGALERVSFVEVLNADAGKIEYRPDGETESLQLQLRSSKQIARFWATFDSANRIYLDVTGLRHHVWAALLRGALLTKKNVVAVYVEPGDYRPSLTPTENEIFDLSERIEGISPLPGFARLRDSGDNTCFIPLLGFEGTRTAYLISKLEPPGNKIVPVVGVPGFRPEHPFSAYVGNRNVLTTTKAWKKIRYAQANCPFDLYYNLDEIQKQYSGHVLKIAPIGTKPHAIGSVLYAIANPDHVELVYDHPIRKAERTAGTGRLLTYHISSLVGQ